MSWLRGKKRFFFLAQYASDVVMFGAAAAASMLLLLPAETDIFYTRFFLFTLLILLVNYTAFGLYRERRNLFDDNSFMQILYSALTTYFMVLVFILMFDPGDMALLAAVSLALALAVALTSAARFALDRIIYRFRKAGYDRRQVLLFGNDEEMAQKIRENKSLGYELIRVTEDKKELRKHLKRVQIVFIAKEHIDDEMMQLIIENDRINWKIVPSVFNLVIDPVDFDEFKDYPILNIPGSAVDSGYLLTKRAMDIMISGIMLLLLSPLLMAIAAAIKLFMPGPVFFMQERLGKDLKPFQLFKFRTMVVGADEQKKRLKNEVKGLFKMKEDPRVTRLGKFLRRTCLDELPQLFNVWKGDMSIVGPRPHLQIELPAFKGWRMARFRVKPGMTGMWQVSGRHELNFDKAVLYDIYYVKHQSFLLDIAIIAKTVPAIIMSRGRH